MLPGKRKKATVGLDTTYYNGKTDSDWSSQNHKSNIIGGKKKHGIDLFPCSPISFHVFYMDSIDFVVVLAVDLFRIISHRHDCHHHYHYHCQYTIIAGSQASGFSVCSCFCVVSFARVLRCLHIMSTRPRLGRPCFWCRSWNLHMVKRKINGVPRRRCFRILSMLLRYVTVVHSVYIKGSSWLGMASCGSIWDWDKGERL